MIQTILLIIILASLYLVNLKHRERGSQELNPLIRIIEKRIPFKYYYPLACLITITIFVLTPFLRLIYLVILTSNLINDLYQLKKAMT